MSILLKQDHLSINEQFKLFNDFYFFFIRKGIFSGNNVSGTFI